MYHRSIVSHAEPKLPKKLTLTNSDNEDLEVLYIDLEYDKDNIKLEHDDVKLTGVNDDDDDDDHQGGSSALFNKKK